LSVSGYFSGVPTLRDALRGVPNASQPLEHLVTAGQPSPQQFEALQAAGVAVVVDIRDPMEPRGFDEPELVRKLGMRYVNISVLQGSLDDASMDAILAELRRDEGQATLLHCASANRVGGALIPYLMLDKRMSEDEAVEVAMGVGLRAAELLEWGVDYARRKTGG